MSFTQCNFLNCKSLRKDKLKFFSFPNKNVERCKKWLQAAGNSKLYDIEWDKLRNIHICEKHFHKNCFNSGHRGRLLKSAIPFAYNQEDHTLESVYGEIPNLPSTSKEDPPSPKTLHVTKSENYYPPAKKSLKLLCETEFKQELDDSSPTSISEAEIKQELDDSSPTFISETEFKQELDDSSPTSIKMPFTCAVPGCEDTTSPRHRFPNPVKFLAKFKDWVRVIGNEELKKLEPFKAYSNYRICHRHFDDTFFCSNNYIARNATPTLFLPAPCGDLAIEPSTSADSERPEIVVYSSEPSTSLGSNKSTEAVATTQVVPTTPVIPTTEVTATAEAVELEDAVIKIEVDEAIVNYSLVDLYYDLEALSADEKPKNWTYNWIETGLLLAYFGDSLRHFSRSLLICRDMTMEVRAEGRICESVVLNRITSIEKLRESLDLISSMFICLGVENYSWCPYGLVMTTNESSRCMSCSSKQKRAQDPPTNEVKRQKLIILE